MFKNFSLSLNSPWIHGILISLILLIVFLLARKLLTRVVERVVGRVYPPFSLLAVRLIRSINFFVLLLVSADIASGFVVLTKSFEKLLGQGMIVALLLQAGIWASLFADHWFGRYAERKQALDPSSLTAFGLLSFATRMLIWLVVALITLENLGADISALVAGLGIGGIAVALAVQNVLGDLLASLSIILDKPFVVGDTIVVGDMTGAVERIGVKTTHIRALSGEQIIIANSDLLGSRIRNFKRMYERRVAFTVGVVYDTPLAKVEEIPTMIRAIIEAESTARFDRAHLRNLGDSAITFEVVYFVRSGDYLPFMDLQQRVNLAILRRFKQEQIEFAFPTQTLVVKDGRLLAS
jgi:small-conductance mechanosensitive channel